MLQIHVTGSKRDAIRDLTISMQGGELDLIWLIDDLDWAAQASPSPTSDRLRALRKAIIDCVGLVAE
jgi:hypothetical protein